MIVEVQVPLSGTAKDAVEFLDDLLAVRHPGSSVQRESVKLTGNHLRVFVNLVGPVGITERVDALTEVESEWNDRDPSPEVQLFVLPSGLPYDM